MHEIMNSKKVSTISNFSRLVDGLLELDILIAEGGTAPIKIPKWCTCVLVSQEVGQMPHSQYLLSSRDLLSCLAS